MPKIAHVQVIPKLSGAQRFSLNILSKLDDYDKFIICSGREEVSKEQLYSFINQMKKMNINIIWAPSLQRRIGIHDIKCFFELYSIFKKYNFDIVHTNSTKPGIVARIAARIAGVKKIIHTVHGIAFHSNESIFKKIFYYLVEAIALQFGSYNVTVNNYYLRYYKLFFWKKSLRIYNGVDFSAIERSLTNKGEKNPDERTVKKILFVGRLDKQKNPLTALRAFKYLIQKNSNVIFDVVGDGELRKECETYVIENNLESKVFFHGWVEEPSSFYNNADIFYCPSSYEAFGFTFVEAAFFGLPIIASNVEGIPEVVIHGKMGFLTAPDDYIDQANFIERLLYDNELYEVFKIWKKICR